MDFRDILDKNLTAQGLASVHAERRQEQPRQAGNKQAVSRAVKPVCKMAYPKYLPYLFRGMAI